jgi:uncharacterized membrane protein
MSADRVPNELLVVAFEGETRADEVLQAIERLHHEHVIDLHAIAVIRRAADGRTTIRESNDFTTPQSIVGGTLVGGLLGLLRGDLFRGALVGAGAGYLAGKALDLGFSDHFLRQVSEALSPNSSALVVAVQFEQMDAAILALDPFHGKILRQTLPEQQAKKFAEAIEGAPS